MTRGMTLPDRGSDDSGDIVDLLPQRERSRLGN
jgi:hypothetical protein